MLSPSYKIKIGNVTFESEKSNEVISIDVNLDISVLADSCSIILQRSPRTEKFKKGDEISISLGYNNILENVFDGKINDIDFNITEVKIFGLNYASNLLNLRVNQAYENQSAGSIVSDLAKKAKVTTGEISDGINFPFYFINSTKNAYEHIHKIAEKCGFDVYIIGNKLYFKKYEKNTVHNVEYGKNLIKAEFFEKKQKATCVKVRGESSSSFKGSSTSHWLTKKDVEGVAGEGNFLLISDPSVKDKDTAEKLAKAKLDEILTSFSQTITIVGNSKIKLDETIEIKNMPNEKLNGEFKVVGIEHILNKTDGFISNMECVKKEDVEKIEAEKEGVPEGAAAEEKKATEEEKTLEQKVKEVERNTEEKIKEVEKKTDEKIKNAENSAEQKINDFDKDAGNKINELTDKTNKKIQDFKKEAEGKINKLKNG
ncbi:MAG: hypothetical protein CVT89_00060 [Candidatus Altiarchaeales archaeon HGW-Altiarchaeales-2]|nr:MAG: hypothetical protein CVT89_00060 [Candidatus Altiarchaeales archaeon HGW-Altiarchaeales-2]